jgi:hypothetical protein
MLLLLRCLILLTLNVTFVYLNACMHRKNCKDKKQAVSDSKKCMYKKDAIMNESYE